MMSQIRNFSNSGSLSVRSLAPVCGLREFVAAFGKARSLSGAYTSRLGVTLNVRSSSLLPCLKFFFYFSAFLFKLLVDICVYERTLPTYSFVLSYVFSSVDHSTQLRVRTAVSSIGRVATVTSLYSNASWVERESHELFGVWFEGHGDARRVVTDYGCDGFVGRREFPVIGLGETFYSVLHGGVVHGAFGNQVAAHRAYQPGARSLS